MVEGVESVVVSSESGEAIITMSGHVPLASLRANLIKAGQYQISPKGHVKAVERTRSWFETYKPVLLIFLYILAVTALIELTSDNIDLSRWMRHFMAGFFLVFSFFKMLNLKGFRDSYMMYDVIARKFPTWAYIYVFTELLLGIAFLVNFNPMITLSVTFIVMSVSMLGVVQTVLNKRAIKCACLGDVFNLPMSTVTIIEDGLMIVMSGVMMIGLVI